mgnify:CR=1 FL=1
MGLVADVCLIHINGDSVAVLVVTPADSMGMGIGILITYSHVRVQHGEVIRKFTALVVDTEHMLCQHIT